MNDDNRNNQPKQLSKAKQSEDSERKTKQREPDYLARFPELVDIVSYKENPYFLVKDSHEFRLLSQVKIGNKTFQPPPREQLPWLLARGEKVMEAINQCKATGGNKFASILYDNLLDYHQKLSELPSPEHYDLLVAWDIHTYFLEWFGYSPIICLFAVPERGKTRTGKSIINVAYRGVHVESLREAYLLRLSNNVGATLFIDVMDVWKKAEKCQSEDMLLQRFERGAKVARVNNPEKGAFRDTQYFDVFGATIIGINEPADRILDTRCIQINMPEASKVFEQDPSPILALPLRESLLAFKAQMLGTHAPEAEKPAAGRLGDILKPMYQIIDLIRPDRHAALTILKGRLEASRKLDKSESLEARIISAMIALEYSVVNGYLTIKEITDRVNEGREQRFHTTPPSVGRKLSSLGFGKTRVNQGETAVIYDKDLLDRTAERYGVEKSSDSSESSNVF